jgi:hypothetical protein
MLGTTPIGGMTITRAGYIGIIRNGPRTTMSGVAPTAIGTTIMIGILAIGGTKTVPTGSANIIMSGDDGMTTTNK